MLRFRGQIKKVGVSLVLLCLLSFVEAATGATGDIHKDKDLITLTVSESQPIVHLQKSEKESGAKLNKIIIELFSKAHHLQHSGQCAKAITIYRRLVQADSKLFAAHFNMALCLEKIGRYPDAEKALEACAKIYPLQPVVYKHLTNICLQQGKDDEAANWWRHYLEL